MTVFSPTKKSTLLDLRRACFDGGVDGSSILTTGSPGRGRVFLMYVSVENCTFLVAGVSGLLFIVLSLRIGIESRCKTPRSCNVSSAPVMSVRSRSSANSASYTLLFMDSNVDRSIPISFFNLIFSISKSTLISFSSSHWMVKIRIFCSSLKTRLLASSNSEDSWSSRWECVAVVFFCAAWVFKDVTWSM